MWFLVHETISIIINPGDDGDDDEDDEGDSAAEDERVEIEQRKVNARALAKANKTGRGIGDPPPAEPEADVASRPCKYLRQLLSTVIIYND